ncbi:MAG: 3-hydroxyacyl-CoA dehydrogenase family protein, partial [Gemmatimonadota bacterium]|nr:3-hydroxyacyl-CoA dehydrogenase family protein [Gemmatimonadota bacterium]
ALSRARAGIETTLARSVEKGRISADDADAIPARITFAGADASDRASLDEFRGSDLVIEAVVEDLDVKRDLFSRLESVLGDDAILGTNTSSLSVTAIGCDCKHPERVIGIHFFNPPTLLPLVEIVPGLATSEDVTTASRALIDAWGKTTVRATDTPGFIVNRIARPYYGEALRIYEEGIADMATIDWAMRELGGFKMGPFELMDFIGNDINFAATRSVFEGTYFDPRYKPFVTQQRLFEAGFFGRKSGRGYYDYSAGAKLPKPNQDRALGEKIFDRILSMLINEAADAVLFRTASPEDVDLAMTKGVNYPKGLLAWADEIGIPTVVDRLESLQLEYGEDRYRPSPLLRRMAARGTTFFHDD